MPYKRRKYERFVMGNLSDSTTINWTLYQRGADKKILESYSKTKNKRNTKTFDFTKKESDIATLLSLEAQAETEGNPKVEVFIEKEVKKFKYNELKAIDNENKNRVAKSGETLYYVHQTGKEYDFRFPTFQIDISPKVVDNEIPTNHIEWIYNGTNIDHDKLSLSRTIHYNDDNKGKIEVQARTGNPMAEKYKKVNVEWVKEDRKEYNLAHNIEKFLSVFKVANKVSDAIGKVTPCKINFGLKNIDKGLVWRWAYYNEEDKNSRQALEVKDFEFIAVADNLVNFKCGKEFKASVFGYEIEAGEIYAQLSVGVDIGVKMEEMYYFKTKKLKGEHINGKGGINVKGELGLKLGAGYKKEGKLIIGLLGGGKINITGGGRVEYPYKNNKDFMNVVFFIDPLKYEFEVEAKMGPLSKSFSYSNNLWNFLIKEEVQINIRNTNN